MYLRRCGFGLRWACVLLSAFGLSYSIWFGIVGTADSQVCGSGMEWAWVGAVGGAGVMEWGGVEWLVGCGGVSGGMSTGGL